jgi:hypothetical protein
MHTGGWLHAAILAGAREQRGQVKVEAVFADKEDGFVTAMVTDGLYSGPALLDQLPADYKDKWLRVVMVDHRGGRPVLQVGLDDERPPARLTAPPVDFMSQEDQDWDRVFPNLKEAPPLGEPAVVPPPPQPVKRRIFLSSDDDTAYGAPPEDAGDAGDAEDAAPEAAQEAPPGPVPLVPEFQAARGTCSFSQIPRREDMVDLHVFVIEHVQWTTTPAKGRPYQAHRVVCQDWMGASMSIFGSSSRLDIVQRLKPLSTYVIRNVEVKPIVPQGIRLAFGGHTHVTETKDEACIVLRPSLDVTGRAELGLLPESTPVALTALVHDIESPSTTTRGGSPLKKRVVLVFDQQTYGTRITFFEGHIGMTSDLEKGQVVHFARLLVNHWQGVASLVADGLFSCTTLADDDPITQDLKAAYQDGLHNLHFLEIWPDEQLHKHSLSHLKTLYDEKGATNPTRGCAALVVQLRQVTPGDPWIRPSCPLHPFGFLRQERDAYVCPVPSPDAPGGHRVAPGETAWTWHFDVLVVGYHGQACFRVCDSAGDNLWGMAAHDFAKLEPAEIAMCADERARVVFMLPCVLWVYLGSKTDLGINLRLARIEWCQYDDDFINVIVQVRDDFPAQDIFSGLLRPYDPAPLLEDHEVKSRLEPFLA